LPKKYLSDDSDGDSNNANKLVCKNDERLKN